MRTKPQHLNKEEEEEVEETEVKTEEEAAKPSPMKPAARKKRKIKKRKIDDDEHEENKVISKSIQQRFAKNKKVQEVAVIKHTKSNHIKIVNPDAHDNMIDRAEELQCNRMYQVETRSDVIPTAWKCALCLHRSCKDSLGDLFGPYYINADERLWPEFLCKKPPKMARGTTTPIDIWLHGDCALWAPDIHMHANQLANLQEKMYVFWTQACFYCQQPGASIPFNSRFIHYPCALKHFLQMDERSLTVKVKSR